MTVSDESLLTWSAITLLILYGGCTALLITSALTAAPVQTPEILLPTTDTAPTIRTMYGTAEALVSFPGNLILAVFYLLPVIQACITNLKKPLEEISIHSLVVYILLGFVCPAILANVAISLHSNAAVFVQFADVMTISAVVAALCTCLPQIVGIIRKIRQKEE